MAEGPGQRSAIYDLIGERPHGAGDPGAASGEVSTGLASATPDWVVGGDGSGSMTSDQKAWTAGGEGVRSLRSGIKKVRTRLEPGEGGSGASAGADDFECGAVLDSLNNSWKRYIGDVSGRCAMLAGLLEKAGNDHDNGDQERRAAFEALDVRFKDTEAVGGGDGDGGR